MLNIILHGCNGKMGKTLQEIISKEPDLNILAGIDQNISDPLPFKLYMSPLDCEVKADVVIDFSHHSAIKDLLEYCVRMKVPVVIATTALGDEDLELIQQASEVIPIFRTANMSIGINALSRMLKHAVPVFEEDFNVEIIEKHHHKKVDSPSGTALLLANSINEACTKKKDYLYGRHSKNDQCKITDLGIHAVRGGTIPGEHTVIFAGPDEVIELTHRVYSKSVFALGALKAAKFLVTKNSGLYSMEDMV
ncbi:4-hydroxy-tetrahydrodipicolinate reductase [Sinanaerobacter chloroacetimidivorans]|uniref:4-hydroxy-tetrahydrodipicolinate reductase n=1 Tax=Sinanaerobacter chloroacetimidivorans TaxID=2818044 RepID=A0A8J7W037_9FIRM|nr:4-hydroxy-tetrahydrodipicolinate reductase [Sinanaerobacter chloroacetimidivorans]MBR0596540.1 4-hydroxy-tetrahydrodipicolinate reductase [Sinanaerobacter chloroacetimidivorans]